MEDLAVVFHIRVVPVNPVLAGEVVHDVLSDQRCVVRQFQPTCLVLIQTFFRLDFPGNSYIDLTVANLELWERPPRLRRLRKSPNDGEETDEEYNQARSTNHR